MTADRLPNPSMLRSGAAYLRTAGDTLAGRATYIRGLADAIGPGFWVDNSSAHTKTLLYGIADELMTGKSALHDAADGLDGAAQFITGKQTRHGQIEARLTQLQRAPSTGPQSPLIEILLLTHERDGIERDVRGAMGRAKDTVDRSARRVARHQHQIRDAIFSFLGGIGKGAAWLGEEAWNYPRGVSHVLRGVWDGTWAMGEGLVSLAVLASKLDPERMLYDPAGYAKDQAAFQKGVDNFVAALKHDPGGVIREIGKSVINYDDMRKDPAHWVGTMIPTIALTVLSDGAGVATKGGDIAADAAKLSATAGSLDTAAGATRIAKLLNDGFDISRYEGKMSLGAQQEGHILERHVNLSDQPLEDYVRDLPRLPNRPRDGVFVSKGVANDVVADFLRSNDSAIEQWLSTKNPAPFVGVIKFDHPIGFAIQNGDSVGRYVVAAKVVLRQSDELPEGFVVQTAYPDYNFPVGK